MRQKLALARVLLHRPAVIFLDEPTAGLDPTGRDGMLNLLGILASRPGRSMVLSTHLLGDVERVCDHVLMLNAGRVLASGRLSDLRKNAEGELMVRIKGPSEGFLSALAARGIAARPGRLEIRLDRPDGGAASIFDAAREAGVQIREFGPAVRSVEELFLSLVPGARPAEGPA